MNWKQARHIEEGKYLIWNPTASPLVTFVCALMLVRSVLPLLHRAAGATKESNLAGSTGMNHFISQSWEPSLRRKATLPGLFFLKETSLSFLTLHPIVSKTVTAPWTPRWRKNPRVGPGDSERADGLTVRKMCLLDKDHSGLWLQRGFSPKTTEPAQDLRTLGIILVEILGFSQVHQGCLWKRCWKAIMTFSP